MRVQVSGHHVEVTPALRRYVERRFSRAMRRLDRLIEVTCILSVDKLRHRAEAVVRVRGRRVVAGAVEDDMYAAIDRLADRIDRGVRKHKERVRDHHAPEAQKHGLALARA